MNSIDRAHEFNEFAVTSGIWCDFLQQAIGVVPRITVGLPCRVDEIHFVDSGTLAAPAAYVWDARTEQGSILLNAESNTGLLGFMSAYHDRPGPDQAALLAGAASGAFHLHRALWRATGRWRTADFNRDQSTDDSASRLTLLLREALPTLGATLYHGRFLTETYLANMDPKIREVSPLAWLADPAETAFLAEIVYGARLPAGGAETLIGLQRQGSAADAERDLVERLAGTSKGRINMADTAALLDASVQVLDQADGILRNGPGAADPVGTRRVIGEVQQLARKQARSVLAAVSGRHLEARLPRTLVQLLDPRDARGVPGL